MEVVLLGVYPILPPASTIQQDILPVQPHPVIRTGLAGIVILQVVVATLADHIDADFCAAVGLDPNAVDHSASLLCLSMISACNFSKSPSRSEEIAYSWWPLDFKPEKISRRNREAI